MASSLAALPSAPSLALASGSATYVDGQSVTFWTVIDARENAARSENSRRGFLTCGWETLQAERSQVAGWHQGNGDSGREIASGCCKAPNSGLLAANDDYFALKQLAAKQRDAETKRVAGIVYNETSGVYPALKPGTKPGGPANWDPKSIAALHDARVKIAEVAYDGSRRLAPSYVPDVSKLSANGKAQWADALAAAQEAYGDKSRDSFVIWPSSDGRVPNSGMSSSWPYSQTDKIYDVAGPFRVPAAGGDVPVGSNIYIFFYRGVK